MKRIYQYKEKRKLEVGKVFDFRVIKSLQLPDNESYYVLLDPFGERHLLPAKYYNDYGLTVGEIISCHVDKVNCQGRIFLEPLHPQYAIGKIYEFTLLSIETIQNKKGNFISTYIMIDPHNNKAYLPKNENYALEELSEWKKYRVDKIKKAKVYLSPI
ncbi:MAG: hypothetical protein P1P88_21125 [Bacteroidales bacterium]|nr:hypothetical protein [Bacteroidales bacterium]